VRPIHPVLQQIQARHLNNKSLLTRPIFLHGEFKQNY
jgi:hypothetical protein